MRLIEGSRTRNIYNIINEELRNGKAVIVAKTGLSASDNKAKEILHSVIGQMSDGIWENTPGYDRYWKNVDIAEEDGEIVIYGGTAYGSPFLDYHSSTGVKDDAAVRKFMAHKIKQIVKIEAEDGNSDIVWKRDCETPLSYMGYDESITVRDCYRVYDKLLGRIDRITEGSIVSMNTDNFEDIVMRDFQLYIEDKYDVETDEELQDRLSKVTEEDVNDYFTGMFYEIVDTDDLDSANEAEKIIRNKYGLTDISSEDYQEYDDGDTNWAAEEEADAIERLEYRYGGRMDESTKPKKEKKPEERIIMQQGNVTCLKKDNKFKVFEDTDANLAEYDNQEEAMRDALNRCGVNPDNELAEEKDNLKEQVDEALRTLLKKKEELRQDDSISDDDYYNQIEMIDNVIINNYDVKEIEEAEKELGINSEEE